MEVIRKLKAISCLLLIVVFAADCNKSEEPNNGGTSGQLNDSIIDHNGMFNGHEYVDLDLPSGTLWATCNVGADTQEGYGDYFAWGETIPKDVYDWKSYKYGNFFHDRYEMDKYCTDSVYGHDGFVDNLIVLEPNDDAAMAKWGAGWRTPTINEWEELYQNTTSSWTTRNGVDGWLFIASNNNSIFLPDAGYWWDSEFNHAGLGLYWSVSLNIDSPNRAWAFHFNTDICHLCGSSDRNRGQTVRAVCTAK